MTNTTGVTLCYQWNDGFTFSVRLTELLDENGVQRIVDWLCTKHEGRPRIVEPIQTPRKKPVDIDEITISKAAQCAGILLARLSRGANA